MKKTILILCILIFSAAFANASQSSQLIGTWKFVSGKYTYPDRVNQVDATKSNAIKIFTPTHFSVISMSPDGKEFRRANAGRLVVKGSKCVEYIDYSSGSEYLGKSYSFDIRFEGDKLIQTGMIDNVKLEETWQRVK
jgi:hypothetical protein